MSARIPVFVSAPTALTPDQQSSYDFVISILSDENLEPRALGRSDYGVDFPLKEVYSIARHCSGGIILGYEQMHASTVEVKPGTPSASTASNMSFPTPWNNLEAGILFSMKLPLMIFRQKGITGGVFDNGVSDVFIQDLPLGAPFGSIADSIGHAMKTWSGKVREAYRAY